MLIISSNLSSYPFPDSFAGFGFVVVASLGLLAFPTPPLGSEVLCVETLLLDAVEEAEAEEGDDGTVLYIIKNSKKDDSSYESIPTTNITFS